MNPHQVAQKLRRFQLKMRALDTGSAHQYIEVADALLSIDPENTSPFPSANSNQAQFLGVEKTVTPGTVDKIIQAYRRGKVERFFFYLHPSPQDGEIRAWLADRGFKRFEGTGYPTLLRPAEKLPAHPTQLTVRQADAADIESNKDAIERIYDGVIDSRDFLKTIGQDGFHHFLAFDGQKAAAGGMLWVEGQFGYLTNAATAEAQRQKGAQSALIAARVNAATALGCKWVASETLYMLKTSLGNLQKKGFAVLHEREVYEMEALL